ncbi:MAG: MarR family transcriptional regulator [Alphaproteobacteria bacterium]|nr:MarR family transcriptional regulator [Alphaproteobacteria bacterium]
MSDRADSNQPGPEAASDYETALRSADAMELRVWLRLLTCANMIERRVRQKLRDRYAITLPRFDLLAQLDRASDGLTLGEISRRLMVSNGNVTGLIERLVAEGLIDRQPSPEDRRIQIVRLTRGGKAAFDAMTPEHRDWVRTAMAGLDRRELAQLLELLGRLKESAGRAATGEE